MAEHREIWAEVSGGCGALPVADIPILGYGEFFDGFTRLLEHPACHCVNYFAYPENGGLRLTALVAADSKHTVNIASCIHGGGEALASISNRFPAVHGFEREMAENFGIVFSDHPWLKPLRYGRDRADRSAVMNRHPFYSIKSDSLHEVVVGPIHAGIIEPGVFRFICNGEEILHLEMMFGYQHRGLEKLMVEAGGGLRRTVLAESTAGDSAVGHTVAYCRTVEALGYGEDIDKSVPVQRAAVLEMERLAMHIADTGALCGDIGYQIGQVACEALRTVVINSLQSWCGNRFGKGLVRPRGSYYPLKQDIYEKVLDNLGEVARQYSLIERDILSSPSVLSRFEDCGIVGEAHMRSIGGVGMAARASGIRRDIRASHPCGAYAGHIPVVLTGGDVMARIKVRMEEVKQSITYISGFLKEVSGVIPAKPHYDMTMKADTLSFSLVEGWRGEICHTAVTDRGGKIAVYKIKDPSLHNWMALPLAVRGSGISDFPICNKSFNLSYCGHDL